MALQAITYLAGGSNGKIHLKKSQRAISGIEVLVEVTHSGTCGIDVHDRNSACGLGHEGVVIIEKVGDSVTAVEIGQRSCGHCHECVSGYRQYCPESRCQKYGELQQGAYGDFVVKHLDLSTRLPKKLSQSMLVPCSSLVGESKKDDAMTLGATEFHLYPHLVKISWRSKMDSQSDRFMQVLARRATIIPLNIQEEPLVIPGSTEASRKNHIDAFTFAARHNIRPWIKEFSMSPDGLTVALNILKISQMRYRAVLTANFCGKGQ
ncbi:NADP-dependent alcohol dehydrogenase [Rhexocercosporidium sp. MPI-PUGE-AT-0058]|nr:NADP-dependent alcohol dehydrogenase [Rhexocercosporidium sp. MPI-PUGE-AT-0058]